jgi:hypothetical protein
MGGVLMDMDIVTELRDTWIYNSQNIGIDIGERAADEIERLRKTMQMMVIDYRTQMAGIQMRCRCMEHKNGV